MFIFIVAFSVTPINWRSREIKALAPLMACVSKPMRMKDFPFQPADTLFQYSLLKTTQQTLSICIFHRTPENITTCTGFFFLFQSIFLHRSSQRHLFFFLDALGLQQKIAYMFLLPKAEDCERVDEWKREQHRARK